MKIFLDTLAGFDMKIDAAGAIQYLLYNAPTASMVRCEPGKSGVDIGVGGVGLDEVAAGSHVIAH